jgi:hypothetical protein
MDDVLYGQVEYGSTHSGTAFAYVRTLHNPVGNLKTFRYNTAFCIIMYVVRSVPHTLSLRRTVL